MPSSSVIADTLIDEGIKARAHYQVWWALRKRALPKFHKAMSHWEHVEFFHAANSGHYTLFMLSLGKIFDRDQRVAGIKELKRALRAEGRGALALALAKTLKPSLPTVKSVVDIRNRTVAHNDHRITLREVYRINGVAPRDLRALIDTTCDAINTVARALGRPNRIFEGERMGDATIKMLEALSRGRAR